MCGVVGFDIDEPLFGKDDIQQKSLQALIRFDIGTWFFGVDPVVICV